MDIKKARINRNKTVSRPPAPRKEVEDVYRSFRWNIPPNSWSRDGIILNTSAKYGY